MKTPIAVLISDIHFSIKTLDIATAALQDAIDTAADLDIPLIIAGDLNDTKAIIRAEVANRLLELIEKAPIGVCILVGNHDLINEKNVDHGLNYLEPYAEIISTPTTLHALNILAIPYSNTPPTSIEAEPGRILIMHQGFQGAFMGDYIQDKTSISPDLVKDYTVISGHYHRHQTIGTVTYIGSPYTMSFGEANDGPKGYLILNDDGSYDRKILSLRKHIIVKRSVEDLDKPVDNYTPGDLVWLQVTGARSDLDKLRKKEIGQKLFGTDNFKFDKICLENAQTVGSVKTLTDEQLLDSMIDNLPDSTLDKQYLKNLWREIL